MEDEEINYPKDPELLDEIFLDDNSDTIEPEEDADEILEDDGDEYVE